MRSRGVSDDAIESYTCGFPPEVQVVLRRIRQVLRRAVPDAEEIISYRMPALRLHGIVLYYAAFKNHIGIYPPIHGSAPLDRAISRYAGEKGNLKLPLDEPIPYKLIERIAKLRARQNRAKATSKKKRRA
jgi:uncharacterized protein YdhG (YjbR/CyaY superfamily)